MSEIADELFEIGYNKGKAEGFAESFSQSIAESIEKAILDIREEAIAEGIEKGRKEAFLQCIKNLLRTNTYTLEEAMTLLGVPEDKRARYAAWL